MHWLLWSFVGFAPTVIIICLAVKALHRPSPERNYDLHDVETILSWLVPALVVLAVKPLAIAGKSGYGLVFLCVLPYFVYCMTSTCLQITTIKRLNPDVLISAKGMLKWVIWETGPVVTTTIFLLFNALAKGSEFNLEPRITLFVLFAAAAYMGRMVFSGVYPFKLDYKRLAPGELSNRMVEIAREQGAEIEHVHIMKTDLGYTGACARAEKSIALSENLVKQLTKPEADAVIAHEVGHLADREIWRSHWMSYIAFMLIMLMGASAAQRVIGTLSEGFNSLNYLLWLTLFVLPPIANTLYTPHHENKASRAAREYGEPASVISGHYKLYKLNHLPLSRPRWTKITATHPTFEEDTAILAKKTGFTAADLEQIYQRADAELESSSGDRYEIKYHEETTEDKSTRTRRLLTRINSSWYSSFIFIGCIVFLFTSLIIAMPLEKYSVILPFVVSFTSTITLIILAWRFFEKRAADEERRLLADIAANISTRNPGLVDESTLLVGALLIGDWDKWIWQPGYLSIKDGQLRLFCESVDERIDAADITDVSEETNSDSSSDNGTFALVRYQVRNTAQWLALRTLGRPPKGQPRSTRQLTRFLREQLSASGAQLKNHKLTRDRIWAITKRSALALMITAAAYFLLQFALYYIGWGVEARSWTVLIAVGSLASYLFQWIKQAGTQ